MVGLFLEVALLFNFFSRSLVTYFVVRLLVFI